MAKKKSGFEEHIVAETGKWNTAKEYSQLMIMKLLYECNEYQVICFHGTSEIIDDLMMREEDKIKARLYSIERYLTTLRMLISNTIGQIKADNRKKFNFYKMKLSLLYNVLPIVKYSRSTQGLSGSHEWIEINENSFSYVLEQIININEEVSGILTEEDLVFYNIEEFDMDKAKADFMKKAEEEG